MFQTLDSGKRETFATGSVRDTREGKGRELTSKVSTRGKNAGKPISQTKRVSRGCGKEFMLPAKGWIRACESALSERIKLPEEEEIGSAPHEVSPIREAD